MRERQQPDVFFEYVRDEWRRTVSHDGEHRFSLGDTEPDSSTGDAHHVHEPACKLSTQATGVAVATTVALGATGITAHFPAGTYANGQTYTTYSQWGNAQRKMSIELEFASATLATADCEIVGYAFVSEGSGTYNAACQIKNNVGAPVAATVVWTYDVFVTNYTTASGNIG